MQQRRKQHAANYRNVKFREATEWTAITKCMLKYIYFYYALSRHKLFVQCCNRLAARGHRHPCPSLSLSLPHTNRSLSRQLWHLWVLKWFRLSHSRDDCKQIWFFIWQGNGFTLTCAHPSRQYCTAGCLFPSYMKSQILLNQRGWSIRFNLWKHKDSVCKDEMLLIQYTGSLGVAFNCFFLYLTCTFCSKWISQCTPAINKETRSTFS